MWAIRFDFPEGGTLYAGRYKGGFGWAPTLATALKYNERETANRVAANAYPRAWQEFVTVIEVPDEPPFLFEGEAFAEMRGES